MEINTITQLIAILLMAAVTFAAIGSLIKK